MHVIELAVLLAPVMPTPHAANRANAAMVSPNGRTAALIRKLGQSSATEQARTEVVLVDISTGKRTTVLRPGQVGAPNGFKFNAAERLTFSPDGKRLYVEADCPCDSGQVYAVDVPTGRARFFAWGVEISVLRNRPWRGDLLMGVHTCYADHPGCDYPVHVLQPDGKSVFIVPNTNGANGQQALARWLKSRGWRAS